MTPTFHAGCRVAAIAVCLLTLAASSAHAQDSLARAKDFYASAAYEEALQVLVGLHSVAPSETSEVSAYQVFCLVALGRSDEAKHAAEALVRADPQYHPAEASPRLRSFFEDVRRPLLPEIVRQSYAKAKDAFDRKEMPAAAAEFDRVIALLDEMGTSKDQGVADLRTLASGFRDFSKVAAESARPAAPAPAPPTTAPASASVAKGPDGSVGAGAPKTPPAPEGSPIFGAGDTDVIPPIALSQVMPPWRPADTVEARMNFTGMLEIVIGDNGKVLAASLTKHVQPRYDAMLLQATQKWSYRPAMKNGKAVPYRLSLAIHLQPIVR